jgi:hypothetical protein
MFQSVVYFTVVNSLTIEKSNSNHFTHIVIVPFIFAQVFSADIDQGCVQFFSG